MHQQHRFATIHSITQFVLCPSFKSIWVTKILNSRKPKNGEKLLPLSNSYQSHLVTHTKWRKGAINLLNKIILFSSLNQVKSRVLAFRKRGLWKMSDVCVEEFLFAFKVDCRQVRNKNKIEPSGLNGRESVCDSVFLKWRGYFSLEER